MSLFAKKPIQSTTNILLGSIAFSLIHNDKSPYLKRNYLKYLIDNTNNTLPDNEFIFLHNIFNPPGEFLDEDSNRKNSLPLTAGKKKTTTKPKKEPKPKSR